MSKLPAKQRQLDEGERATIASLYALGRSPTAISEHIGRDKGTVLRHIRNDTRLQALIEEQRETLAELFEATAREALLAITGDKLDKAGARDLGVLAGICTEKHRLLIGASTSNSSILLKAIQAACEGGGEDDEFSKKL